jgi:phage terminase small subunit
MPALLNARREQFAQNIARGMAIYKAYEMAGFQPSRSNASRTAQAKDITGRVREILDEKTRLEEKASREALDAMKVDRQYVISNLVHVAETCMGRRPVQQLKRGPVKKGKGGKAGANDGGNCGETDPAPLVVEVRKFDSAGANRSLELLGKELGMFIDRKEVRQTTTGEGLDADIAKLVAQLLQADPDNAEASALAKLFPVPVENDTEPAQSETQH